MQTGENFDSDYCNKVDPVVEHTYEYYINKINNSNYFKDFCYNYYDKTIREPPLEVDGIRYVFNNNIDYNKQVTYSPQKSETQVFQLAKTSSYTTNHLQDISKSNTNFTNNTNNTNNKSTLKDNLSKRLDRLASINGTTKTQSVNLIPKIVVVNQSIAVDKRENSSDNNGDKASVSANTANTPKGRESIEQSVRSSVHSRADSFDYSFAVNTSRKVN